MELIMRTTLNLDDELLAKATLLTGIQEKSTLMKEALAYLVQRESARRLAALGGSMSKAKAAARRRPTAA
jgi:Arc/MetJ family transcription regulator